MKIEITDDQIKKYINETYSESFIRDFEDKILSVMKMRQEEIPSDKNKWEWQIFSVYVCKRRAGMKDED